MTKRSPFRYFKTSPEIIRLGNLTPADVYFGRGHVILSERRKIKEEILRQRRLLNQTRAA